jgi:hypothetical protein
MVLGPGVSASGWGFVGVLVVESVVGGWYRVDRLAHCWVLR